MTRGDLCLALFAHVPVTSELVARVAGAWLEEVDAFYKTLRVAGLVDLHEPTGVWFPVRATSLRPFLVEVIALGVDVRHVVGSDDPPAPRPTPRA